MITSTIAAAAVELSRVVFRPVELLLLLELLLAVLMLQTSYPLL
jgi:hypothetical protein